jgi:hypothetical protein
MRVILFSLLVLVAIGLAVGHAVTRRLTKSEPALHQETIVIYEDAKEVTFPVTVVGEPIFLGGTAKTWSAIQIVLLSIGLTGLVALVATEVIDRKEKPNR